MKQSEIAVLIKGMAPVIGKLIAEAVQPFADRVKELEQQLANAPTPRSVSDALIDQDGRLVLTHSDGSTKTMGRVEGKDATGKPGNDGLGFDELDIVEGEGGLTLRFARGEVVKEFPLPVVFDRGVYREDATYRKGNGVTWAGSFWIAQKDGPGKPDTADSGWRLAVKKGRDMTRTS